MCLRARPDPESEPPAVFFDTRPQLVSRERDFKAEPSLILNPDQQEFSFILDADLRSYLVTREATLKIPPAIKTQARSRGPAASFGQAPGSKCLRR
jgi:hypothetical protein